MSNAAYARMMKNRRTNDLADKLDAALEHPREMNLSRKRGRREQLSPFSDAGGERLLVNIATGKDLDKVAKSLSLVRDRLEGDDELRKRLRIAIAAKPADVAAHE